MASTSQKLVAFATSAIMSTTALAWTNEKGQPCDENGKPIPQQPAPTTNNLGGSSAANAAAAAAAAANSRSISGAAATGGSIGSVRSSSTVGNLSTGSSTATTGAISNNNTAGSGVATSSSEGSTGNNTNINTKILNPVSLGALGVTNLPDIAASSPCYTIASSTTRGFGVSAFIFAGVQVTGNGESQAKPDMDCNKVQNQAVQKQIETKAEADKAIAQTQADAQVLTELVKSGTCPEGIVATIKVGGKEAITDLGGGDYAAGIKYLRDACTVTKQTVTTSAPKVHKKTAAATESCVHVSVNECVTPERAKQLQQKGLVALKQ